VNPVGPSSASHLVSGFHTRNSLPHLKGEGGTYFVTFRLADTLPRELILQLKVERDTILRQALAAKRPLTWHEQEELFRWYSARVDTYLDAGHGECFLKRTDVAELVKRWLKFFDGERYELRSLSDHAKSRACCSLAETAAHAERDSAKLEIVHVEGGEPNAATHGCVLAEGIVRSPRPRRR
jgi:hypothetical protein